MQVRVFAARRLESDGLAVAYNSALAVESALFFEQACALPDWSFVDIVGKGPGMREPGRPLSTAIVDGSRRRRVAAVADETLVAGDEHEILEVLRRQLGAWHADNGMLRPAPGPALSDDMLDGTGFVVYDRINRMNRVRELPLGRLLGCGLVATSELALLRSYAGGTPLIVLRRPGGIGGGDDWMADRQRRH